MNKQKNLIPSAKLISHFLIDFSSEAEMELFINYVEKIGANFYENIKNIGLIRFRLKRYEIKKVVLHYLPYMNIMKKILL